VRLRVRVTPKSPGDKVDGIHSASDGTCWLKVRVRAQPDKGKANAAVTAVVAKAVGLAKSDVALISGAKDRNKTLSLTGETSQLTARIDALIDAQKQQ
jgi:hypothetical protein